MGYWRRGGRGGAGPSAVDTEGTSHSKSLSSQLLPSVIVSTLPAGVLGVVDLLPASSPTTLSRKSTTTPPAGRSVSMVTVTACVFGSASREKPKSSVTRTTEGPVLSPAGRTVRDTRRGGEGAVRTR